jgi:phosphopantetheine--protein transferase-like protein
MEIGIDILEIKRARFLYKTYQKKLKRYLSQEELSYIRSSRNKVEAFAAILALKEAVFKALNMPWFGLQGWRKIALKVEGTGELGIRFSHDLKKDSKIGKIWINVCFTKDFVLVRVWVDHGKE